MAEELNTMYPDRFDLPSVYHIKCHVQTVLTRARKEVNAMNSGATEVPGRKNGCMSERYSCVLEEIVREKPTVKPLLVVDLIIDRMELDRGNLPSDFPEKAKITQKVGGIKQKIKHGK